jgi:hypothetical protein
MLLSFASVCVVKSVEATTQIPRAVLVFASVCVVKRNEAITQILQAVLVPTEKEVSNS